MKLNGDVDINDKGIDTILIFYANEEDFFCQISRANSILASFNSIWSDN